MENFDKEINNSIAKEYTVGMKDDTISPSYNPTSSHMMFQSFNEQDPECKSSKEFDINGKLMRKRKSKFEITKNIWSFSPIKHKNLMPIRFLQLAPTSAFNFGTSILIL